MLSVTFFAYSVSIQIRPCRTAGVPINLSDEEYVRLQLSYGLALSGASSRRNPSGARGKQVPSGGRDLLGFVWGWALRCALAHFPEKNGDIPNFQLSSAE